VPLNFDSASPWHIEEASRQQDSIRLWLTKTEVDTLVLKVISNGRVLDTVRLEYTRKESGKKSAAKKDQDKLGVINSAAGFGFNQFKGNPVLTFSYPLSRWDFSKILLIKEKDTVHPEIEFADSLKRRVTVIHKWEESKSYRILIPDSVFAGIYKNRSHDTLRLDFRTKSEKDFGNLIVAMNMENRPGQYIVQLMNEKETVLYEEKVITGSCKIHYDYMPPGKYKLKAIFDRNRNNRWDTGNYRLKIQPEPVMYFKSPVEIRANWDVEETWD